jgi:hypothetical protein
VTFASVIQLFIAILKAPAEIRALVLLLSKSPEEKRQEIAKKVDLWMKESSESSRPKWDE